MKTFVAILKPINAIIFVAFTLTSCKKSPDEFYTITVRVLDWDSRTPISGARVYAGPFPYADSIITDPSGTGAFRFNKNNSPQVLQAYKNGYLPPGDFLLAPKSRTGQVPSGRDLPPPATGGNHKQPENAVH